MKRREVEKSLKRFLKKKISYSLSLLVTFMITGGISLGEEVNSERISETKDDILIKIQKEKDEINRKKLENKKRIEKLLNESTELVKKGNYFSKSIWESYFGVGIFDYIKADKQNKEWVYSDRKYTNNDLMREEYSKSIGNKKGTGWINRDKNWQNNSVIYDNKSELIIIPTLKIPVVKEPTEPKVDFVAPNAPLISELPTVNIGNIPTVTVNIPSYTFNNIIFPIVNIPNYTIEVKDQEINPIISPVDTKMPTIALFPNLNNNIPIISTETTIIPKYEKYIPEVPKTPEIPLPSWNPYERAEVSWLGRSVNWHWFSRFNGFYNNGYANEGNMGIHNLFDNSPAYAGAHNNPNTALLETVIPRGGTFVAIPADISYSGKVITLKDKNGNTISTAGGQPLSGWNTQTGDLLNRKGDVYTGFTDPYNDGNFMAGQTFVINNNEAYNQAHYGIFKILSGEVGWPPYIDSDFNADNITVHIGSENNLSGSLLIDGVLYDRGLTLTNSEINLYGNTLFFGGYIAPRDFSINLSGTKINIYGNNNTFFHLRDKPSAAEGGKNSINTSGQINIDITEPIISNTSRNALLIVDTYDNTGGENTKNYWVTKHAYAPFHTPIIFKNTGSIEMYGAENIVGKLSLAVLKAKPNAGDNPINEITAKISFGGDQNIGLWFADDYRNLGPNFNAVFAGDLNLEFSFGEKLQENGLNIQNNKGNIVIRPDGTAGDNTKVENSIGLIIESGQRKELNTEFLYPATAPYENTASPGAILGIAGIFDSLGNVESHALIKNVKLDNYKVIFGKYSKDNIGIVAKNGSVIDWSSNVTDNAPIVSGNNENSTAQGTTLAYAEGIFWNSRQRGLSSPYSNGAVDYTALSQQGGKYYIPEFRTTINITDNAVINSIKSIPFYAKDGGLINTKNIVAKGFGTTIAVVFADKDKADIKTGSEIIKNENGGNLNGGGAVNGKVNWSSEDSYYGPAITDADGNILTHSSILPAAEINIDGDIEAVVQGPRRDNSGNIISNELVNDNSGAIAKVKNGTNGAKISITGNIKINGLGAFADGTGALIKINGNNSEIKTGKYGALVAVNNGKIEFGGGTIEHKETYTGSHDSSGIFYAESGGSISFKGLTTINIYNGYPFAGNKDDYSAALPLGSETGKYQNMNNVEINLMQDGIILGVKENAGTILWSGMDEDTYLEGIKNDYKLNALNTNGYKWQSIILGSTLQVQSNTNIDLDSNNDSFNNLVFQRSKLILDSSAVISSNTGKGLVIGSTEDANFSKGGSGNAETGYEIDGKISILGGTVLKQAIALYTSYGHIKIGATGEVSVDNGIGAYGVNGSEILNKGKIEIKKSGMGIAGIAHKINSDGTPDNSYENYGTDVNEATEVLRIDNQGNIVVGNDSIGIYAENNMNISKFRAVVNNSGIIKTGDNSVGIMLKATLNNSAPAFAGTAADGITASITGNGFGDIEIGKNSTGIHAEKSSVNLNSDYGINLKDRSVGIYVKESIINGNHNLNIKYMGSDTGTGIGILFENKQEFSITNNNNILVDNSVDSSGIVAGIYLREENDLVNNGNISHIGGKYYGIISDKSSILNNGIITTGQAGLEGGTAIYAKDPGYTGGNITTDSDKIIVNGNNSVGIHMVTTSSFKNDGSQKSDMLVLNGSIPLTVDGDNSIGIIVENKNEDINANFDPYIIMQSGINLISSADVSKRKIGFMQLGDVAVNFSSTIDINSNNIGWYVENSNKAVGGFALGILNISGTDTGAIGMYSKNNSTTNLGNGIVLSGESKNIGVLVENTEDTVKTIENVAITNITTNSMLEGNSNIGLLIKGNKIKGDILYGLPWTIGANSIGTYFDGDSTTVLTSSLGTNPNINIESDSSGRIGIGSYFTGGAYADSSFTFNIKSNGSALDSTGEKIKPIGIYYGKNSAKNEAGITIISSNEAVIGLYGNNLTSFENTGKIKTEAGTQESVGAYFKKSNVKNTNNIDLLGDKNVGIFVSEGKLLLTGNLDLTGNKSIGIIAQGNSTTFINQNNNMSISGQDSAGISALEGAAVSSSGDINISNSAYAGISKDQGSILSLNNGEIKGNTNNLTALIAKDSGKIILSGGNISLKDNSVGIFNDKGKVEVNSGNISIGENSVGIYSKDGNISIIGTLPAITMKNNSIAVRNENSFLNGNGVLNINYAGMLNKGIGIYYKNSASTINDVEVRHTGDNLINIYSNHTALINNGNQLVQKNGIGIYSDGGTLANIAQINLVGDNTAGIYLDNGAVLSKLGTITGNSSAVSSGKVGIYVNNGDITGNSSYNFSLGGGIGIYLKNTDISYNGTMTLSGNSTLLNRTIGIYAAPSVTGTISTNLNITGKDAIGIYLAKDLLNSANIVYDGKLDITSLSANNLGIGAILEEGTVFALGNNGRINIGGTNNVGFYIKNGALFNVLGGTVTNTKDDIFAYLDGGNINFNSSSFLNINYANVIAANTGNITNDTVLNIGTVGLQGLSGSTVLNSINGILNGSISEGKAIIGDGAGTNISNHGEINLTGNNSVGIYVNNGAMGISTGKVAVKNNSIAYYAGNGASLNISGISSIGAQSVLLYAAGGSINYTAASHLTALENKSIGILLTSLETAGTGYSIDLNGKNIIVGTEGTGVLIKDSGNINEIVNIGNLIVGTKGIGIYSNNNNNIVLGNNIELSGENAVGILTNKNGDIDYSGMISTINNSGKGIISFGTGNLKNYGNIKLLGESSIGIYGKTSNSIINQNTGIIEVGSGSNVSSSIGIYGENANNVLNDGIVKFAEYGVGIYGKNNNITNNGSIIGNTDKATGIYAVGSSVNNTGNIIAGHSANGIFVKNGGSIVNTGNITVGGNNSSGIYGTGTTNISHNSGVITTGNNSIGIATNSGNIIVNSGAGIIAGKESTHIYTISGTAVNNADMQMSDYSVGMYTNTGVLKNNANIVLGKSDKNAVSVKISIGMAAESGTIENHGIINVKYDSGIGMVINKGGAAINYGDIDVLGKEAYGMQGMNSAILENRGTINVNGINSKGIVAINKTLVKNIGTINVNGNGAQGIYIESGSKVDNNGSITVNGYGKTGIYIGDGGSILNTGNIVLNGGGNAVIEGTGSIKNIGDIIIKGPSASIDGITIDNTGKIEIPGVLDFNTIKISGNGLNEHIGTINAETFKKGEFLILSDVTQGSNHDMYIVQYLGTQNEPNAGEISAISQSVSFVADIQKDPTDGNKFNIVLVKIPYEKMLKQTAAENFGIGLDDLYTGAKGKELEIFDLLDKMSNKDELISTFENELRGNEYANIQDRMLDIENVFDNSYNKLKHEELYTKESLKIGAIVRKSEAEYKNAALNDYEVNTIGATILKEYDHLKYGCKSNLHLGFAQSKFDFTDRDSLEKVYSLNIGAGYEDYIDGQNSLKWYLDGDILINYHEMDRKLNISGSQYSNEGKYWSGTAMIKNKIRYEILQNNEKINIGLFGTFNLGYGKFEKFKEKGDGVELALQSNDMYIVRPGVGTDITLNKYTDNGKISLKGKLTAEYELGEVYDGANKAKIKNSSAQYYSLEKPKKMKEIINVGAEVKYETREGHAVSFEIAREEGRRDSMKYGINLIYKF